jgi:hypothetical protein
MYPAVKPMIKLIKDSRSPASTRQTASSLLRAIGTILLRLCNRLPLYLPVFATTLKVAFAAKDIKVEMAAHSTTNTVGD